MIANATVLPRIGGDVKTNEVAGGRRSDDRKAMNSANGLGGAACAAQAAAAAADRFQRARAHGLLDAVTNLENL
jgi:hypothetical protein